MHNIVEHGTAITVKMCYFLGFCEECMFFSCICSVDWSATRGSLRIEKEVEARKEGKKDGLR